MMHPLYTVRTKLDVAEGDVISLLQKFKALQDERMYTYNIFHEGHKMYLASGPNYNFPRFRQIVHDVTQDFKRISEGILTLEERIRPIDPKLAAVIQHLQDAEKTKLQLTARQQLALQKLQETPEPNHDLTNELAMIRKSLITVTETVVDCCEEVKYALHEYMNQDRDSEGSASRKNSLDC